MTDGKKPDSPGEKPGPPVPTPLSSPALPAVPNLKDTSPYYPSPAQLKDARPPPEYANTVVAPKPAPTPFELGKTQPSMANPVLAKLQAEERAAAERLAAERAAADRAAAEKAANARLVAERQASALRAATTPDRSALSTDPMRAAPPPPTAAQAAAAAARAQALRQQLASRPVGAPPKSEVPTDPLREAVGRAQPPGASTVVQRPPQPPGQPKTDPMQQPDVLAAISRGQPQSRVAIPPPPPATPRAQAAPPRPPGPLPIAPLPPMERTEVRPIPLGVAAAPPTETRPVGVPPMGHADRTQVRPIGAPPPGAAAHPPAQRTEVRAMPAAPPPGVPMPAAAERTEVRSMPAAPPPGVPMPAAAERTEVRPMPAAPPLAEPRTDVAQRPFAEAPKITAATSQKPALPHLTAPPRDVTPLPDLTPVPPRPALTASPAQPMSQQDLTPVPPRPAQPMSQPDLTPVPPRPAVVEAPPSAAQWTPPEHTAPSLPPSRPAPVVPPSLMDLPPAMEKPRRIDAGWLTTQPNMAGPFATQPSARPPVEAQPDPTAEEVPSNEVMARPAAAWRRVFAWLFDGAILGGMIGGALSVATTALAAKPVPNGLHGFDVFLFRLGQIAIPALAVTVALALVYTVLGAVLLKGRTPGRLLFGIRLVDSSGQRPGAVRAVVRAVFALVSFALFLSGFWLALFDRRGQTLHDKLTRTFVIRPV